MKKILFILFLFSSFFTWGQQTKKELIEERDKLLIEISKAKWRNLKLERTIGVSPKGIHEMRDMIEKISDNSTKVEFYKELQKEVEYRNQLANDLDKESSCNVTSLSEVFAFMGKDKTPDELNDEIKFRKTLIGYTNEKDPIKKQEILTKLKQYGCDKETIEQCVKEQEKYYQKGTLNKEYSNTRKLLADKNGIRQEVSYPIQLDKNKKEIQVEDEFQSAKKIEEHLNRGNAVMMSVGGHIVRVVDIKKDEKGNPTEFIINDPFGKGMNFVERDKYLKKKEEIGIDGIKKEVKKMDTQINDLERRKDKTEKDMIGLESLKTERNKLASNGYGCLSRESCPNKNDKDNKSQKGKEDTWSIKNLKDSGIGIKYYEVYSPKN